MQSMQIQLNGQTYILTPDKREGQGYENTSNWEFAPIWRKTNEYLVRFIRILGKPEDPNNYGMCEITHPQKQGRFPALLYLCSSKEHLHFLNCLSSCNESAAYRRWKLSKSKIGQQCPVRLEARTSWGGGDRYEVEYEKYFMTWDGDFLKSPSLVYIDSESEVWGRR